MSAAALHVPVAGSNSSALVPLYAHREHAPVPEHGRGLVARRLHVVGNDSPRVPRAPTADGAAAATITPTIRTSADALRARATRLKSRGVVKGEPPFSRAAGEVCTLCL